MLNYSKQPYNTFNLFTEKRNIEALVLTERIETIVPIIFIIIFSMSYFGPNAEHLGNVKLTIWHYIGIENIEHEIIFRPFQD